MAQHHRNSLTLLQMGAFLSTMVAALLGCNSDKNSISASSVGAAVQPVTSTLPDGVYGVSSSTVQIKWTPQAPYTSASILTSTSGSDKELKTNFTDGYIKNLLPRTSYFFKLFGVDARGVQSSTPIKSYQIVSWPTFEQAPWQAQLAASTNSLAGTQVQISWNYAPWNTLAAGDGVMAGTMMVCSFVADQGKGTDPFSSTAKTQSALLSAGSMTVSATSLGMKGLVRIGCQVNYTDHTTSRSLKTAVILFTPALSACAQTGPLTVYDQSFKCTLNEVTGRTSAPYRFQMSPSNTCRFVTVSSSGDLAGTPDDSDVGTCTLTYQLISTDEAGLSSSDISQNLTVVNRKANWTTPPLSSAKINEISRNDPGTGGGSGSAPNFDSLVNNATYTYHVTDAQIQTDKETQSTLKGKSFGSYHLDAAPSSSCQKFGRVFHYMNSVKVDGMNGATGEFYFQPIEHYFGTCTFTIYFDDNHPSDHRSASMTSTLTVLGYNDPPEILEAIPSGSLYSCNSHCYVDIDYYMTLSANTGGSNIADPANTAEKDQKLLLKPGNCISSDPTKLKITLCEIDSVTKKVNIGFKPIGVPTGLPPTISVVVSDNGDPTNSLMPSATFPKVTGNNTTCLAGGTTCQSFPNSYRDSTRFSFQVDITKFYLPIKPALVVSKAGCLMCHAQIKADVVTDFGNVVDSQGNPVPDLYDFFVNDPRGIEKNQPFRSRASDFLGWGTLTALDGTLYVKRSTIPLTEDTKGLQSKSSSGVVSSPPMDLATFLRSPGWTNNGNTFPVPAWGKTVPSSYVSLTSGVIPNISDTLPNSKPINQLTISAPISSDIQAIAQDFEFNDSIDWLSPKPAVKALYRIPQDGSRPFSGLSVVQKQPDAVTWTGDPIPTDSEYVSNRYGIPIQCFGDVVVKGNLFLDSPNFQTDAQGCRIHVDGSIIFHGYNNQPGITVSPPSGYVQVTSTQAISFGLAINKLNDGNRLLPKAMVDFATMIGVPKGSECTNGTVVIERPSGGCPSGYQDNCPGNCSCDSLNLPKGLDGWNCGTVTYQQLMVNAPVISGRYLGTFKGSIITDYALFRLGQLTFDFDPVFSGVVPFPRLQTIQSAETHQPRVIFGVGE